MTLNQAIKFCNLCGSPVSIRIPEGDNQPRHVCTQCNQIQYQNPKIVTGCIPVWEDQILLCKRAIQPRHGYWTVPAGFMENLETLQQGAIRETMEEACAAVKNVHLFGVYSLPKISQVYVIFRADLKSVDGFAVGNESLEVKLFDEAQIPWDQIAFRVVEETLRRYLSQRQQGNFEVEISDLS